MENSLGRPCAPFAEFCRLKQLELGWVWEPHIANIYNPTSETVLSFYSHDLIPDDKGGHCLVPPIGRAMVKFSHKKYDVSDKEMVKRVVGEVIGSRPVWSRVPVLCAYPKAMLKVLPSGKYVGAGVWETKRHLEIEDYHYHGAGAYDSTPDRQIVCEVNGITLDDADFLEHEIELLLSSTTGGHTPMPGTRIFELFTKLAERSGFPADEYQYYDKVFTTEGYKNLALRRCDQPFTEWRTISFINTCVLAPIGEELVKSVLGYLLLQVGLPLTTSGALFGLYEGWHHGENVVAVLFRMLMHAAFMAGSDEVNLHSYLMQVQFHYWWNFFTFLGAIGVGNALRRE
jgi:hypothetical protein